METEMKISVVEITFSQEEKSILKNIFCNQYFGSWL